MTNKAEQLAVFTKLTFNVMRIGFADMMRDIDNGRVNMEEVKRMTKNMSDLAETTIDIIDEIAGLDDSKYENL